MNGKQLLAITKYAKKLGSKQVFINTNSNYSCASTGSVAFYDECRNPEPSGAALYIDSAIRFARLNSGDIRIHNGYIESADASINGSLYVGDNEVYSRKGFINWLEILNQHELELAQKISVPFIGTNGIFGGLIYYDQGLLIASDSKIMSIWNTGFISTAKLKFQRGFFELCKDLGVKTVYAGKRAGCVSYDIKAVGNGFELYAYADERDFPAWRTAVPRRENFSCVDISASQFIKQCVSMYKMHKACNAAIKPKVRNHTVMHVVDADTVCMTRDGSFGNAPTASIISVPVNAKYIAKIGNAFKRVTRGYKKVRIRFDYIDDKCPCMFEYGCLQIVVMPMYKD